LKRNRDTKLYGKPVKVRMAEKRTQLVGDTIALDQEASLLQKASQVQDTPVPVESGNPIEESDTASCTSGPAEVVDMKILAELVHAQAMGDHSALESLAREIAKRARAAQAALQPQAAPPATDAKVSEQLVEAPTESASFKVCVHGLEFKDFDIEAFRSHFARCGKITDLDVLYRDKARTRTLGRCTITFKKKGGL